MRGGPEGSFKLFRFAGIDVYLHWLWFLLAFYQISERKGAYFSLVWNVAEYVALFGIVLLHEFGHAFATRQVGGTADTILLWPLGGVAYVAPPPRPGAELWSIAAGPLVNVVLLIPLTFGAVALGIPLSGNPATDWQELWRTIWWINLGLLIFNLLPIYPLDGGQILRSLLWFVIGPIRSLYVASVVGFVGVAGLAMYALYRKSIWLGILAFFTFTSCRQGWQRAQALAEMARARGLRV
ncbi:MAG: site-2 protease family protein [Verrucomicrobia bacterium]|nr:site-2 protease family protein [Verrucomicrobiota bacterium]